MFQCLVSRWRIAEALPAAVLVLSIVGCSSQNEFDNSAAVSKPLVGGAQKTQAQNVISRFIADLNTKNGSDLRNCVTAQEKTAWSDAALSKPSAESYKPFAGSSRISYVNMESVGKGNGVIARVSFHGADGATYLSGFTLQNSGGRLLIESVLAPQLQVDHAKLAKRGYAKLNR